MTTPTTIPRRHREPCSCLACAVWDAIYKWHEAAGRTQISAKLVAEAAGSVYGETLGHIDDAKIRAEFRTTFVKIAKEMQAKSRGFTPHKTTSYTH